MDGDLILLLPQRLDFTKVKDHCADQPKSDQYENPDSKLKLAVCQGEGDVSGQWSVEIEI
jgi:hypothetical protein